MQEKNTPERPLKKELVTANAIYGEILDYLHTHLSANQQGVEIDPSDLFTETQQYFLFDKQLSPELTLINTTNLGFVVKIERADPERPFVFSQKYAAQTLEILPDVEIIADMHENSNHHIYFQFQKHTFVMEVINRYQSDSSCDYFNVRPLPNFDQDTLSKQNNIKLYNREASTINVDAAVTAIEETANSGFSEFQRIITQTIALSLAFTKLLALFEPEHRIK